MPASIPIVAIVGRPNVGKSTLFNRYAGRRQALVENEPGVTRDRLIAEIDVSGRAILIVDTAGLDRHAARGLGQAVQAQAWTAVREADAILFVVDGQSGLVPEDESLAKTLHRASKPVTLVVNKIDVPAHEPRVAEFHALGFARVEGVSAEHGRGAWDAIEALVAELPEGEGEIPDDGGAGVRVALVGRPNVGKSSLVNRLAGIERVVVSDVPGTTRDAIDTRIERDGEVFTLVDTAGLRRGARRSEATERVSALMSERSLDRARVALVAIDASEGFTDQDARVAQMARERGCATAILANKWDLVAAADAGRAQAVRDQIARGLRFMSDAPVLAVSALTGAGVDRILAQVTSLAAAGQRRIPTSELNRWLEETVSRHEPAMAQRGVRRHPLKLFYATQTSVAPPSFVIFCNQPDAVKVDYRRFLENRLRERFDLAGTPIRIRLRARQH